jgi:hypothetical protein
MCGVTLRDRRQSVELRERLDIECVAEPQGWLGVVGWDGLGMLNESIRVTGCQPVESLRLRG